MRVFLMGLIASAGVAAPVLAGQLAVDEATNIFAGVPLATPTTVVVTTTGPIPTATPQITIATGTTVPITAVPIPVVQSFDVSTLSAPQVAQATTLIQGLVQSGSLTPAQAAVLQAHLQQMQAGQ